MAKNCIKYLLFFLTISILTGCAKDNSNLTDSTSVQTENTKTITPQSTEGSLEIITDSAAPAPVEETEAVTNEDKAAEILLNMTLEEKIGQMFFVRCPKEHALDDISTYHLGGYILFGDDFKDKTPSDIKTTLSAYQKEAEIPLLIGADEEGGTVNRISKYSAFRKAPFQSPQDLYKEGGLDLIIRDTREKAELLKSLGINVNLAPVCDVSTNSEDFINARSFGKDASQTSDYVRAVVTEMKDSGIGSTLKHFPGYGDNVDTHTGIAIDERSYETFENSDFLPFQAGIESGADSILVSHNVVKSMDHENPASLSGKVHEILRSDLGFHGVIMTDDLSMDAIKNYTDEEEAAVLAISAGNDLVVATDYSIQIPAVITAVKNGDLSEARIDESVTRILLWKLKLGLLEK